MSSICIYMFPETDRARSLRSNSIMIEKTSDDLRPTYSMTILKQLFAERHSDGFIYYSF